MKGIRFPMFWKKSGLLLVILLFFLIFFLFFQIKNNKNSIMGNTINNGMNSIEKIESDLCKISYYQALIEVTVQSNKNKNTYTIKQEYQDKGEEFAKQEVIQPENLEGVQIIKSGDQLEVRNTTLNLSKIYEKYENITQNDLWLNDFMEEYQNSSVKQKWEEENHIIFQVDQKEEGMQKKLYVNKETGKPLKLGIKDENKKDKVYIEYKEIELRSTEK